MKINIDAKQLATLRIQLAETISTGHQLRDLSDELIARQTSLQEAFLRQSKLLENLTTTVAGHQQIIEEMYAKLQSIGLG